MKKMKRKIKSFGRGYKLCENCHTNNGVRTKICKKCGHEFPKPQPRLKFKKLRKSKLSSVDWKTLQKGDRIRVLNQGGTVFEGDDMVYNISRKGVYIVNRVVQDGLYLLDKNGTGITYLYMGPKKENKFGFINNPHKIKKILD